MRGSTAGMSEVMIAPPQDAHAMFLTFIDIIFSSVVLAPTVVVYWRGTWNYMDKVLLMDEPALSGATSLAIGFAGHMVCSLGQHWFTAKFHPDRNRIAFQLVSRMYTYAYGICCANGWRAGWIFLQMWIPPERWVLLCVVTSGALVALVLLKGLRNIVASPFALATDHSKDFFTVPTRFKTKVMNEGFDWEQDKQSSLMRRYCACVLDEP